MFEAGDVNKMTSALRAPSGGDFKLKFEAGDDWFAGDEGEAACRLDTVLSNAFGWMV